MDSRAVRRPGRRPFTCRRSFARVAAPSLAGRPGLGHLHHTLSSAHVLLGALTSLALLQAVGGRDSGASGNRRQESTTCSCVGRAAVFRAMHANGCTPGPEPGGLWPPLHSPRRWRASPPQTPSPRGGAPSPAGGQAGTCRPRQRDWAGHVAAPCCSLLLPAATGEGLPCCAAWQPRGPLNQPDADQPGNPA